MANDTFTDEGVEITEKRALVGSSMNSRKRDRHVTTNALQLDEPSVWLGILQDWILSARQKGLKIEPYDLRPEDNACVVVMQGVYFCTVCGNFSRGNGCMNGCGNGSKQDSATGNNQ